MDEPMTFCFWPGTKSSPRVSARLSGHGRRADSPTAFAPPVFSLGTPTNQTNTLDWIA